MTIIPNKINEVPPGDRKPKSPPWWDEHGQRHPSAEEKLQRSANRAAHKSAKTEQNYDQDHHQFTDIGPHWLPKCKTSLI